MKRILALLLTFTLVVGLAIPVLADDNGEYDNGNGEYTYENDNGEENGYAEENGNGEENDYDEEDAYAEENGYDEEDAYDNGEEDANDEELVYGPAVWEMFERPFGDYAALSMFGYLGEVQESNCGNHFVEILDEDGYAQLVVWFVPALGFAIVDAQTGVSADLADHTGEKVYVIYGPLTTYHDVPQSNALAVVVNADDEVAGAVPTFAVIEALEWVVVAAEVDEVEDLDEYVAEEDEYENGEYEAEEADENGEEYAEEAYDEEYDAEEADENDEYYAEENGEYYEEEAYENDYNAEEAYEEEEVAEYNALQITVDNGGLIVTLNEATELMPYLTREFLSLDALNVGDEVLLWLPMVAMSYPAQATATRLVRIAVASEDVVEVEEYEEEEYVPVEVEDDYEQEVAFELVGAIERAGVTLFPVRDNADLLGFAVSWNHDLGRAELTFDGGLVTLAPGAAFFYVNGVSSTMNVPSLLEGGRMFAPASFFAALQNL